jgi:hypothetical protein
MKIYPKEISLGLSEKISASRMVTAKSPVRPTRSPKRIAAALEGYKQHKTSAAYNDLYYVDTLLVTAGAPYSNKLGGWNQNDDFFMVEETWRARHTPVDKPTNIDHIPDLVCGHMTRSWALTAGKRKSVPDNRAESELPETIHIACSAVIYRDLGSFYQSEINKLILGIEAGEMAVSMEAHFNEFDYALLDESTGTVKIVARNDETAWMTGLLRWFGGPGVYSVKDDNGKVKEYYRVGRALRDITFTGKGFVRNPANPDSIILENSFEPKTGAADGKKAVDSNKLAAGRITVGNTNSNKGEKKMSDIDPREYAKVLAQAELSERFEKERNQFQVKCESLENQIKANEKSIGEFELGVKEYKQLLEANKKEKEKDDKEKAELADQLKAAKEEKEKDEKDKKEKAEKIEKLEKELAEIKAAQQTAERQTLLLKEDVDAKEAEAFVKIYANFNDEQFKTVASTYIENHKAKAAFEQLVKEGKVTAADLEKMNTTVDAKDKEDDEKKKKEEKCKSSAGGLCFQCSCSVGW